MWWIEFENNSELLQNVKIICGDYRKCKNFIDNETFVYIDPPYRPLTQTSSFTSYSSKVFDDKEQIRLAKFINVISEKGAIVVASNSDPQNTDETICSLMIYIKIIVLKEYKLSVWLIAKVMAEVILMSC